MLITTASLSGAVSNLSESASSTEFLFIKLFTTSGSSVYSFATFLAFLGPLVGITLGFDAINNERSRGTLNRLAAQPIYRDSIINAKFLAGATVILLLLTSLALYLCGAGLLLIGVAPSVEEVLRIAVYVLFSAVYVSVWLALAILFSVTCKHAATAALASMSIWLFLTFFMSLVASGIAGLIFPTDGIQGYSNLMSNYELNLALDRISPYYLYSEAATTILNPSVRSIGITTMSQMVGALSSYLSFGRSLLLVWPHLVVMAALAIALFAAAYISFMRQEIRA